MYFENKKGKAVDWTSPYSFVKWDGFGTIGHSGKELPKGKYYVWFVDQANDKTSFKFHLYSEKQHVKLSKS